MPFVTLCGRRIEYEGIASGRASAPSLVLLHEGLGSVAMWRDFPAKLAAATGCPTIVYSRYGYGKSESLEAPHGADYMHREALEMLPALREALGLADVVLVGHSDGASIALIHAGAGRWPARALILEAPHVFTEEMGLKSIAAAIPAYQHGDLKARLARYHDDVDSAFYAWNRPWLLPAFRRWNIEQYLPAISCPVLAIQGKDDIYGTLAHLDAIERQVKGLFERLVLPQCGHSPHRDQEQATLAAMARFIARVAVQPGANATSGPGGSA